MKSRITPVQLRDTAFALLLILLIAFYATRREELLYALFAVLVAGMTVPALFTPAARFWFGLSHAMGQVMSRVIMGVLFFLLVVPLGLLRRCLGKDSLRLRQWKKNEASVFAVRDKVFVPEDIKHPY